MRERDKPQAVILPAPRSGHVVYVQSPNGRWALLSGAWRYRDHAAGFIRQYGYRMAPDRSVVLDEIEQQMQDRADRADLGERLDS